MKGQIKVGNIAMAVAILSFMLVGGFTLYANFLTENDMTPTSSYNNQINSLASQSNTQKLQIQNSSSEVSTVLEGTENTLISGSKPISTTKSSGQIAIDGLKIAQNATTETQIPVSLFALFATLISLLVIFAVAGALWRWDLI